MQGTVINNSNSNEIQAFMTHIDTITNIDPNLKNFQGFQIATVGKYSPADSIISNAGNYIYAGVWNAQAVEGGPDSWIIFDKSGKVLDQHFNHYSMSVTWDNGWILTINNHASKTTLWIILGILALLILIATSGGIAYYFYRNMF